MLSKRQICFASVCCPCHTHTRVVSQYTAALITEQSNCSVLLWCFCRRQPEAATATAPGQASCGRSERAPAVRAFGSALDSHAASSDALCSRRCGEHRALRGDISTPATSLATTLTTASLSTTLAAAASFASTPATSSPAATTATSLATTPATASLSTAPEPSTTVPSVPSTPTAAFAAASVAATPSMVATAAIAAASSAALATATVAATATALASVSAPKSAASLPLPSAARASLRRRVHCEADELAAGAHVDGAAQPRADDH